MLLRDPSAWTPGPAAVQPLVLVVEDDPQMRRFLVSTLASDGFRSLHAASQTETLTRAAAHEPDLVLIDISRAGIDGVGLVTRLRQWVAAPVLVVLGQSTEQERSALLDAGANDYITKPFGTGDLLARVRVWLRQAARVQRPRAAALAAIDRFRIDRERKSLFVDGREVHITPLEYKLLTVLAHKPGAVMTEEEILGAVWDPKTAPRAPYLRAQIRQVRQKIERDPARPRHLLSEHGGYRLKLG